MTFNKRVTVVDGWAVTDNEDGSQTRARLEIDQAAVEPERGDGMWNAGVILYRVEDNYGGDKLDFYEPMENILSIIQYGEDRNSGEYRDANEWMFDREQVCRYFRIFHDAQFAKIVGLQNYRDRANILVVAEGIEDGDPEAIATATLDEWKAWANGDVYVVASQTRTLAESTEEPDWSDIMSDTEYVGGYYGDEQGRYGVAEALGVSEDMVPENVYEYMNMI